MSQLVGHFLKLLELLKHKSIEYEIFYEFAKLFGYQISYFSKIKKIAISFKNHFC